MTTLRSRRHPLLAAAAIALLFLASSVGGGSTGIGREGKGHLGDRRQLRLFPTRRWLVGPGSSPPTCRARCGVCFPCRPVHVAVQPGRSFPLEYYPEAWRCKCGSKLFMP